MINFFKCVLYLRKVGSKDSLSYFMRVWGNVPVPQYLQYELGVLYNKYFVSHTMNKGKLLLSYTNYSNKIYFFDLCTILF